MKTVAGQTDQVVVVGAGLSGLAAALHLVGAGRRVTVLERADHPGGRVGLYRGDDYEIDSGATILTMPELIDEALGAVGHTRASVGLEILAMAPAYRARFADGSVVGVYSDPDEMTAEVTRVRMRLRDNGIGDCAGGCRASTTPSSGSSWTPTSIHRSIWCGIRRSAPRS